jgi:hypothetical protein
LASGWVNWVLKGALVAGTLGLGYFFIESFFAGSSCSNTSSACYQALKPYQEQYQICASEYSSTLQQYLAENNANGTGFTSAQLSNLATLTDCMNVAAKNIAGVATQYNQNAYSVLETLGEIAVVGALALIGLKLFSTNIATIARSGATAASKLFNTIVRAAIFNNTITTASASAVASDMASITQSFNASDQDFISLLASENIITAEEAAATISEDGAALLADQIVTQDLLEAV